MWQFKVGDNRSNEGKVQICVRDIIISNFRYGFLILKR
jgi:hypothetical protein